MEVCTKCLGYYPVLIHREEERHALSDCRNAMGNSNCRETEVTMALDVLLYFFLMFYEMPHPRNIIYYIALSVGTCQRGRIVSEFLGPSWGWFSPCMAGEYLY